MNKIEFYKETNFKQTEIGEIPIDWKITNLSDKEVAEIIMGQSPPSTTYNKNGRGLPFLQGKMEFGEIYPSPAIYCSNPLKVAEQNDVLISVRAPVGDVNIAPYKLCIGRGLAAIRFNPEKANFQFYFYYLKKIKSFLENLGKGSTFKAINRDDLERLKIPLPPFEEQRAVAWVLSVVDLAIQRTDMVIAKTERLKKGLMQTLLTRGIGHKEFKDTEIGKIPKTWRVATLGEIAKINKEQIDPTKSMPDKTFIYIDIDSVENETGKIRNPKKILGRNAPSRARRVVHENDVIMSTVRPYLKAFAIIPKEYDDQICSTGFAVLSCKKDIVIPYFLLIALFSENVIKQCNQMMMGGQYPALNQSQVSRIKIPLPSCDEQEKIASIFYALDEKLELERIEKKRLEMIKKGLMDLLLTGKVRVKVN